MMLSSIRIFKISYTVQFTILFWNVTSFEVIECLLAEQNRNILPLWFVRLLIVLIELIIRLT